MMITQVRFSQKKAEAEGYKFPNFPDLTDGKIYTVEGETEIPDDDDKLVPAYMLVEDDSDPQVPYEMCFFEVVA